MSLGSANDVGGGVVFLASEPESFVTSQNLAVSGGRPLA